MNAQQLKPTTRAEREGMLAYFNAGPNSTMIAAGEIRRLIADIDRKDALLLDVFNDIGAMTLADRRIFDRIKAELEADDGG